MKLKPLLDNIIVEPIKAEEVTKSGIILPSSSEETPEQGIVIKVGPGKKDIEMQVNEGDRVVFSKYGPSEVNVDNKKYLILKQEDILAIIE